MARVSSARAPVRRISVRESLKAPGWASLITLLSDTAYHSFIGEVEALNTTTIRRLTPLCRHQLLAIARHEIIRNRVALGGEESVSAVTGGTAAGSIRRTHPCASTSSAMT